MWSLKQILRVQSIPPGRYDPATGKTVSWNVTASEVDVVTETLLVEE
jgi:hypothetical protein